MNPFRELMRSRSVNKYILFEMLPSFVLGIVVFVFILLMFQALRLTEFVLIHGVRTMTILDIMLYLSVSFLPVIFPMSLLFSVLLTYGRLAADSELIALRASGFSMLQMAWPALLLGTMAFFFSAQTSFNLAPWGNRQFEVLINDLQRSKTSTTIRAGVFSEGFFDLVVYANTVDPKSGLLQKVFIYDERQNDSPLTIIAASGELIQDPDNPDQRQLLRLRSGNIHRTSDAAYTKIDFDSYDINLSETPEESLKKKSALSYSWSDLQNAFADPSTTKEQMQILKNEFYRRWALSLACLVFAFVGVALSVTGHRRSGKSSGLTMSILLCVAYWVMYIAFESTSKSGFLPTMITTQMANLIFLGFGIWQLRRPA